MSESKFRREYVHYARIASREGFSDAKLAELLGVAKSTVQRWSAEHPEFGRAVRSGKESFDCRVERALLSRALGLTLTETTTKAVPVADGEGGQREEVRERRVVKKRREPDFQAAKFWLSKRRPELWGETPAPNELDTLSEEEIDARIKRLEAQEREAAAS